MSDAELLKTAQACHQRGQLDKASRLYTDLLRRHPRHPGLLGGLAILHYQRDQHGKALELFDRAMAEAPADPGLLLNRGNCLQALGRLEEATEAFRRAAGLMPFPEAHLNLGNVLCSRGLLHEAIPEYRRALALRPSYPRALRRLALALAGEACLSEEHAPLLEAAACLNAAASQAGDDAELRAALARCDWRLARYGRDLGRFAAALERLKGPEQVHARKEYARLALDLGDEATATGALTPPPPGWGLRVARAAPCTWSAERPLGLSEERDGILLAGQRDWLVLRGDGALRFEDMTNADPEAGQYVRAISPGRRILAAIPDSGRRVEEAVLVGGLANYYHWLLDYLPRLRLLSEDLATLPLAVNAGLAAYQADSLEVLGITPERLLPLEPAQAVSFGRLVVPDLGTLHQQAHPDTLSWLRQVFGPAESRVGGRRLWISRADATLRRVVNEDEAVAALGCERVIIGTMTIRQQAALFAEADLIVAPHGAALTNVLFCRPGTRVVELMPGRHQQLGFFPQLAAQSGLGHTRLACEPRPSPEQEKTTAPQNFDMRVPVEELVRVGG